MKQQIIAKIHRAGGKICFADYMQMALYSPQFGYYTSSLEKFGRSGDFVTAPEISPLFSQCLAQYCQKNLTAIGGGNILEFGAGSGRMAQDILMTLAKQNSLPDHYFILELSAQLRQWQQQYLQTECPELYSRVIWLDRLPELGFKGVILANEVLDAMPVHLFYRSQHEILEKYVGVEQGEFVWKIDQPCDPRLIEKVTHIEHELGALQEGYTSEINLFLDGFMKSIGDVLERGSMVIIDYGFERPIYYHPERAMGTLMCHSQHQAHPDPFTSPGLQDITAHVDFSALIDAGIAAGLKYITLDSQANFLLSQGITELVASQQEVLDTAAFYNLTQGMKRLLMPSEMGELFKVCVFESV